jgi:hypothetical protein
VMSAEVLEVGWLCVTLVEMTNARGRALPAACEGAEVGAVSLTPFSSAHARLVSRQSSLRTRQRLQLSARACTLSMRACTLSMRVCSWHAHRRDARTQHAILNGMDTGMAWTQGWHGHLDTRDMLVAPPLEHRAEGRPTRSAPLPACEALAQAPERPRHRAKAAAARLTGSCQAQTAKTRRRRAARARRAAPAVARPYQHLGPSEQPSRRPPIAPVVGLGAVLHSRTVDKRGPAVGTCLSGPAAREPHREEGKTWEKKRTHLLRRHPARRRGGYRKQDPPVRHAPPRGVPPPG